MSRLNPYSVSMQRTFVYLLHEHRSCLPAHVTAGFAPDFVQSSDAWFLALDAAQGNPCITEEFVVSLVQLV